MRNESAPPPRSPVQVLDRAFEVLACFERGSATLSLADLVEATGLAKTTLHRILTTLVAHGVLSRDRGRYRLGYRLLQWGALYRVGNDLQERAVPVLRRVRDVTGETTYLFIREGCHRVCIGKVDSPHAVRQTVDVGSVMPLHVGSAGKVLLAFTPPTQREHILLEAFAGQPRPEGLEAELEQIRREGWASSFEEREVGAASASVAVFDFTGRVVAALGVGGPAYRITPETVAVWAPDLLQSARDLSASLGHN